MKQMNNELLSLILDQNILFFKDIRNKMNGFSEIDAMKSSLDIDLVKAIESSLDNIDIIIRNYDLNNKEIDYKSKLIELILVLADICKHFNLNDLFINELKTCLSYIVFEVNKDEEEVKLRKKILLSIIFKSIGKGNFIILDTFRYIDNSLVDYEPNNSKNFFFFFLYVSIFLSSLYENDIYKEEIFCILNPKNDNRSFAKWVDTILIEDVDYIFEEYEYLFSLYDLCEEEGLFDIDLDTIYSNVDSINPCFSKADIVKAYLNFYLTTYQHNDLNIIEFLTKVKSLIGYEMDVLFYQYCNNIIFKYYPTKSIEVYNLIIDNNDLDDFNKKYGKQITEIIY